MCNTKSGNNTIHEDITTPPVNTTTSGIINPTSDFINELLLEEEVQKEEEKKKAKRKLEIKKEKAQKEKRKAEKAQKEKEKEKRIEEEKKEFTIQDLPEDALITILNDIDESSWLPVLWKVISSWKLTKDKTKTKTKNNYRPDSIFSYIKGKRTSRKEKGLQVPGKK